MNPVLSNDYFLTTVKCGATEWIIALKLLSIDEPMVRWLPQLRHNFFPG